MREWAAGFAIFVFCFQVGFHNNTLLLHSAFHPFTPVSCIPLSRTRSQHHHGHESVDYSRMLY